MATMQHVTKINNMVVEIVAPTHNGYMVQLTEDKPFRLIVDEPKFGRVVYRGQDGQMVSQKVDLV